jgi:tetratricopeptide (TPR) repeat protein
MEPYDFDKLWNYGDPAATEEKFRTFLPAATKSPDPEYHPQLLTQIARTFSLRRNFDEAHALLDTVEPMLTRHTPVAKTRYLLERGRAFNSAGKKDDAKTLFLEAFESAKAAGADFFTVDAAHMMAIVEPGDDGLAWNMKAIAFAENSSDPRAYTWLGSLYNNTGWDYHEKGEFNQALDLFQRALVFREKQGNADNIRIARWCIGRCLRSLERNSEALEIQHALLMEAEASGGPDGYTHEELGELYLIMGQPHEATPHFAAAFDILSKDDWLLDNEPKRIARLKKLAETLK